MDSSNNRPDELRVLHWNIHSWRDDADAPNVEAVTAVVEATDPHLVSLVEVDESWEQPSLLDEVAARTGYASIFVPTFEFGHDVPVGGFGNALLSRLPIRAVRQRQLLWPPRRYDGTEPSEPRSVVFAHVESSLGTVCVGSAHLPRADDDARRNALLRLTAITAELTEPWLLVGDFNTRAHSWLDGQSPIAAYPASVEPTYPTQEPVEAIDYCVAPRGLTILVETLATPGSDHLPVLVRYRRPMPHTRVQDSTRSRP